MARPMLAVIDRPPIEQLVLAHPVLARRPAESDR